MSACHPRPHGPDDDRPMTTLTALTRPRLLFSAGPMRSRLHAGLPCGSDPRDDGDARRLGRGRPQPRRSRDARSERRRRPCRRLEPGRRDRATAVGATFACRRIARAVGRQRIDPGALFQARRWLRPGGNGRCSLRDCPQRQSPGGRAVAAARRCESDRDLQRRHQQRPGRHRWPCRGCCAAVRSPSGRCLGQDPSAWRLAREARHRRPDGRRSGAAAGIGGSVVGPGVGAYRA